MKRIVLTAIIPVFAAVVLFFAGCGKSKTTADSSFKVVASFYPVYIIAKNVTGGVTGVSLSNMTPPVTGCLHDYSVTTDDMKKLEGANVFLANGTGMESFMDKITGRYPSMKIAELSKGIKLIKDSGGENPHVWVSAANAAVMTRNCASVLADADPSHAKEYRANAEEYAAKLEALDTEMKTALAPYRGRKIVTFHEAFPYFAAEFGFEIAAVVEREP
ncbi:MAG TPA: metal ABC transporter substrate-binding protein, partial [Spirochaetota bacterium]|nr:metal ABC transporter substrate-binding protein [Spirochaetota bacterium]